MGIKRDKVLSPAVPGQVLQLEAADLSHGLRELGCQQFYSMIGAGLPKKPSEVA